MFFQRGVECERGRDQTMVTSGWWRVRWRRRE